MPKKMDYDNSPKNEEGGGSDSAAKSGGGSVEKGLSSQNGMGNYANGDPAGDHMPKGGAEPEYKVKKAGKTFTVC